MIFRLAALASVAFFTNAQEDEPNTEFEAPASADLMRAAGVEVTESEASGVFTVRNRDLATFDFRWEFDGVSNGELSGLYVMCGITAGSTTENGEIAAIVFNQEIHVEDGGESITGTDPDTILAINSDECYLNWTTELNPGGELRGNIQADLINSDSEQASGTDVDDSPASSLTAVVALVSSIVAGVAALL